MQAKTIAICSSHIRQNAFRDKDSSLFPDSFDFLKPLADRLATRCVTCSTIDSIKPSEADLFLFIDMPERNDPVFNFARRNSKPRVAVAVENYFVLPANRDSGRFADFDAAFTYDDSAVSAGLARKFNYTFPLPASIGTDPLAGKRKLACMIFTNRKRTRPHMLYYRRLQTIDFFEKNHPADFDLYGHEWDRGTALFQTNHPRLHYYLRHLPLPHVRRPSWRGTTSDKRATFAGYRFGYCYENSDEIPGYITEKMFDVMLAGSVPVYLGHPSTARHIPHACYVERSEFPSEEALYQFLKTMPDETYRAYLRAINAFLSTDASQEFWRDRWVGELESTLLKLL